MFTLVIGAAGSGKSEYAEGLLTKKQKAMKENFFPAAKLLREEDFLIEKEKEKGNPLIYIATMQPWDEECLKRIEKHRKARAGKGFFTIERYLDLAGLILPKKSRVLLECLSNLMANELYAPEGGGREALLRGTDLLLAQCEELVIVTNEVFSGGSKYEGDSLNYLRELAAVNRILAPKADRVIEVVCGCPNILKGEER